MNAARAAAKFPLRSSPFQRGKNRNLRGCGGRLGVIDEVRDRPQPDGGGETEERRQCEPLIDGSVADVGAADERALLDLIDRARRRVEVARAVGVEILAAV